MSSPSGGADVTLEEPWYPAFWRITTAASTGVPAAGAGVLVLVVTFVLRRQSHH
jgi:hypothetical protein